MKRVVVGILSVSALLLAGTAQYTDNPQPSNLDVNQAAYTDSVTETNAVAAEKTELICDGVTIAANCSVDGVKYSKYIYHPAVQETTRTETIVTYKKEISDYCTLCRDGSYSPSCATGRGACSHHGGVAQWNAPRYRDVPVHNTKTVIDTPAREAYYEKVAAED